MNSKKLLVVFVAAVLPVLANAQQSKSDASVEFRPHWSIQIQGGAAYTLGETSFGELLSPAAFVNAQYKFIPALGARVGLGGWQGKGCHVVDDYVYSYKFGQLNADLLLDLTSLFGGFRHDRAFTAYLLGGVGGIYGFDNSEAEKVTPRSEYYWETKTFFPGRFGAGFDVKLGEKVSLGLEANANVMSDKFNSKRADNADWQFNLLAGLTIQLGKNNRPCAAYLAAAAAEAEAKAALEAAEAKRKAAEEAAAAAKRAEEEAAAKAAAERAATERAAAEAARQHAELAAAHSDNVYFTIGSPVVRKSEKEKVLAIAEWLKANPDFSVALLGCADKETGNPSSNMTLSEKRAKNVKAILLENGVEESRILTDWKGDTVQPFEQPVKNRVVICTLK